MPTRNRRLFVGQAIWYFLRQDYPHRELLILDDGADPIADLVPHDSRIRYIRLEQRMPLGAKRNYACELSRGELIAHWDDDDWMAADRLTIQVAELLASNADVCGLRNLLHYRPEAGDAWLYQYPPDERPWLAGGTLIYRRAAWAAQPFPPINVGEDSTFVWQLPPDRLHAIADPNWYVALIHGGNTGAKNLADPHWQRRPLDAVSRLIAPDRDFYITLRNGRTSSRTIPQRRPTSITLSAPLMVYDGYGSMAEYLALGMARAGATINIAPIEIDPAGLSTELHDLLRHSQPEIGAPVLYFCWPRPELARFDAAPDLFINTMWESSQLPASWLAHLNRARAVIVPTRFVARVCRDSGVTIPIEVIPEGIDPDLYQHVERPDRPDLTTLIVGTAIARKHMREGIAAWHRAFADDPAARLIIKTRFAQPDAFPRDPRIRVIDASEPTRGIRHWYAQADLLLALGNEGFGLPLIEGMATGLPVIALNSEGQSDICEEAPAYVLPVAPARYESYDEAQWGRCGVRGVPGVEEIARKLRWVADHRDEARAMGRAASEWARRNRNIWAKAPAVLDVMERYTAPPRPLRRLPTIWTASWGTPCGIAEYTAHLAVALPNVRIAAQSPDPAGVRLLHIQHGDGLYDDRELTRHVQQAHNAAVPVVITEHTITTMAHAWERDVDVLVALTERGADLLRATWPTQRVEHIPHGCPTWFPPRKHRRGRVIGAFGFLERHKGFWQLLDVLRALPDSELLLFSYAKNTITEAAWDAAAAGLPIRRVREFRPIEDVARQLAAQADVLVFWYDDSAHASASGAVRIGLASGVPVLASPTGWFRDLRDVTYQPETLIAGVQRLLDDSTLRETLTTAARDYCHDHCWPRIAERHLDLWRSLASA